MARLARELAPLVSHFGALSEPILRLYKDRFKPLSEPDLGS